MRSTSAATRFAACCVAEGMALTAMAAHGAEPKRKADRRRGRP